MEPKNHLHDNHWRIACFVQTMTREQLDQTVLATSGFVMKDEERANIHHKKRVECGHDMVDVWLEKA